MRAKTGNTLGLIGSIPMFLVAFVMVYGILYNTPPLSMASLTFTIIPVIIGIVGLIAQGTKWGNINTGALLLFVAGIGAVVESAFFLYFSPYLYYFNKLIFIPIVTLIGGAIVILGGILVLASKSYHDKQLESLSQIKVEDLFSCPKCGTKGAIRVLKLEKDEILVKQGCPNHGMRSFRLPIELKNSFIPYFQEGIFRCIKCGQKAESFDVKFSGP